MEPEPTGQFPFPWDDAVELQALASARPDQNGSPHAESICTASVWQMDSPDQADAALAGESSDFVYRRDGHPNERILANKLALLHGAVAGQVTAQGMSAIAAIVLSLLRPGDQVWVADELYGKTNQLFTQNLPRWNVLTRIFDPTSADQLKELAASPARLVFIETMSNPRLRVPDVRAVSRATHQAGGLLAVDNTFATPLLCRPLDLGADLVMESLSKQVNGHSDSMLGLVVGSDEEVMSQVSATISTYGLASSPLDCFLTHRGLTSLAVRLERACHNAISLAERLRDHPRVESVDYPGLVVHPQHALAKQQLRGGYGWMLNFHLPLDRQQVSEVFQAFQPEIKFVPSLGDIATTLSHPASTSHRGLSEAQRQTLGIREGTLRISCGVEPTDWLVNRFSQALNG